MTTNEKIRVLREEGGFTQRRLAHILTIGEGSLRAYENGRPVPITAIKEYMNFFNVSYEYLTNDKCNNRHPENINIGKKLHLTDKTINKIEKLKNCSISGTNISLSDTFNHALQNINLPDFVLNIELVKQLDYIVYSVLEPIINIFEDKGYISKQIKNKTLKLLFDRIELLNTDISEQFEKYKFFITYYTGYDFSLRDMKHSFYELKYYLFSEKQNNTLKDYDLNDYIDNYLTDTEEIIRRLEGCIRIFKNGINEEIYAYLNNIKIENREKANQNWRDIYGSTRNNKKQKI